MEPIEHMKQYAEEVGGVYTCDDIEAIPYNHWKKDCEWLVFIVDAPYTAAFVPVNALTAREACYRAIHKYIYNPEEDASE